MRGTKTMRAHLLSVVALIALVALSACGKSPGAETGRINVALLGQAASGTQYRLRTAIITVQGPSSTLFFNTEDDPNRTALSATVPVGGYDAFLQEGWRLERVTAGGTGIQVQAELLSVNPQFFDVANGVATTVALRFRAGNDTVVMDEGSFDIVIDVEEGNIAGALCTTQLDCSSGQTCCLSGFLGTCLAIAPGQECPLPDLTVSASTAALSMSIGHQFFPADSCSLVEECVGAAGDRRLLSFSTETPNVGNADMILGDPTSTGGFEFSTCHNHYHFEGYARYELLDSVGAVAATGHKQAFCLLDSVQAVPGAPATPRYHCGFQGIQRGWADIYGAGLDCQWVDITGVAAGEYSLRITINADHTLPESDYENNTITLPVTIGEDVPPVPGDVLGSCTGQQVGTQRDCGWTVAAGWSGVTCEPGTGVQLGCGCLGGSCANDPVLRVCEGTEPCLASAALAANDDSCGLCPEVTFACPASGVYSVLTGAYNSLGTATCEPSLGGGGGPGSPPDAGVSPDASPNP